MIPDLAAYVSVTFFLVITPGMTTAVVIQQTVQHGHRGGVLAAAGAALGNATHATAAGLGIAMLLGAWPPALSALSVAGGLYLCWIGTTSLVRAWREPAVLRGRAAGDATASSLRLGWLTNVLNPSIATFYLAVVPGFLPPAGRPGQAFALLAAIHISLAFACHLVWALAVTGLRDSLSSRRGRAALDALAGAGLLWLGLRTLVS